MRGCCCGAHHFVTDEHSVHVMHGRRLPAHRQAAQADQLGVHSHWTVGGRVLACPRLNQIRLGASVRADKRLEQELVGGELVQAGEKVTALVLSIGDSLDLVLFGADRLILEQEAFDQIRRLEDLN